MKYLGFDLDVHRGTWTVDKDGRFLSDHRTYAEAIAWCDASPLKGERTMTDDEVRAYNRAMWGASSRPMSA